jgi:hypothetical protein
MMSRQQRDVDYEARLALASAKQTLMGWSWSQFTARSTISLNPGEGGNIVIITISNLDQPYAGCLSR